VDVIIVLIILIGVLVVGFVVLYFQLQKLTSKDNDSTIDLLTKWMSDTRADLRGSTTQINKRLDEAAKYIGALKGELGQLSEFRAQIRDFSEFLRSPKLRGGVGEQVLKDLLSQYIPKENFYLQYQFRSGQIVDAAVKIEQGLIPIDAKFPMENFLKITKAKTETEKNGFQKEFEKDVKRHIDSISAKYLVPDEGTIDFALMYIPSEPVAYEILNSQNLSEYAHQKHVLPVSPNSFYYFLRLIILGLEGRKMEEKTKFILQLLKTLRVDAAKVGDALSILTKHIKNAYFTADDVNAKFTRLSSKIESAQLIPPGDGKRIKKPEQHEAEVGTKDVV